MPHDYMRTQSATVRDIPLLWVEPERPSLLHQLVIFLPHLGGTKEQVVDILHDLADDGFVGLSFDAWQHGQRGQETNEKLLQRVFEDFRSQMWPILGQTTLDVLKVIDWAERVLRVAPRVRMGGLSMGGDVAVAAAGLDARIERVVAVVATPDWLRPGMHDLADEGRLVDQGRADAYAQFFYDTLDPLSHAQRYRRPLEIRFLCGELDTHVPPEAAQRFQHAMHGLGERAARVGVKWLPGLKHLDVRERERWWPLCRERLSAP